MQRLVFLIDGIGILLFLWIVANVLHAIMNANNRVKVEFFWLSNKIRGIKK